MVWISHLKHDLAQTFGRSCAILVGDQYYLIIWTRSICFSSFLSKLLTRSMETEEDLFFSLFSLTCMIVFFSRNCVTIICLVLFSYLLLSKLHFINIYAYRLVCIFAMSFMVIILWRNEFMFFLIIYVTSCFF